MNLEGLNSEIEEIAKMVSSYENEHLQKAALELIPITRLKKNMHLAAQKYKEYRRLSPLLYSLFCEKLFILQLLTWFKQEFFRWFSPPVCSGCRKATTLFNTIYSGVGTSIASVEIYKCMDCQWNFFFPRHTDVSKLLLTRIGRCSEWAQVFCLMCRALGLRTRYVLDVSDHVWTEIYSEKENRWIHCDPPEGVFDNPLMYENDWGRHMTAVIGISSEDIQDITWRYTSNHRLVQSRRSKKFDFGLLSCILQLRKKMQSNLTVPHKCYLLQILIKELVELMSQPQPEERRPQIKIYLPGLQSNSSLYFLKPFSSYTWKPLPSEINNKEINILYCCSQNYYYRSIEQKDIFQIGWQSCVHNFKNVFRKIEDDWKMVYISREERTVGSITWYISTEDTKLAIGQVEITCQIYTKSTGLIKWELSSTEKCISAFNRLTYKSSLLAGSQKLLITANLLGGEGDIGWQCAQINRQAINDKQPSLHFRIALINL